MMKPVGTHRLSNLTIIASLSVGFGIFMSVILLEFAARMYCPLDEVMEQMTTMINLTILIISLLSSGSIFDKDLGSANGLLLPSIQLLILYFRLAFGI